MESEYGSDSGSEILPICRKSRLLPSSDDESSDKEIQENWILEWKENIDIKQFSEVCGINPLSLRKLHDNSTPLKVLRQVLTKEFWSIEIKETIYQTKNRKRRYCKQQTSKMVTCNFTRNKSIYCIMHYNVTSQKMKTTYALLVKKKYYKHYRVCRHYAMWFFDIARFLHFAPMS